MFKKSENCCPVCGGKFGLVRYYSWSTGLCSKECRDKFRAHCNRDRNWLSGFAATALVAATVFVSTTSAHAAPDSVGVGSVPCSKYLEFTDATNNTVIATWVHGYATALNVMRTVAGAPTYDVTVLAKKVDQIAGVVYARCQQKPLENVSLVVLEIVTALPVDAASNRKPSANFR